MYFDKLQDVDVPPSQNSHSYYLTPWPVKPREVIRHMTSPYILSGDLM